MKFFSPSDSVTISIKFTKVLYAQLRSQEFVPPASARFRIPPQSLDRSQLKAHVEADVGMKISCGFEMLVSGKGATREGDQKIVDSIKKLLETENLPTDQEVKAWPIKIDSDDWLDIDYQEFELNLKGSSGGKTREHRTGSGYGHKAQEEKLKRLVENFEKFLNEEGDCDGIKFGEDGEESDDCDDDDSEEEEDDEGEDKGVSFDEKEFERMMREMVGLPPEDPREGSDSVSGIDEEAEIREVMGQVGEELKEAGILDREI